MKEIRGEKKHLSIRTSTLTKGERKPQAWQSGPSSVSLSET